MGKGIVFMLNAAPGVGKSALLRDLSFLLPDGFALADGDDLGRTVPYRDTLPWLDLIQDNIVSCCKNYGEYGCPYIIAGFVFPVRERLFRLQGLLEEQGFAVEHIVLTCAEPELRKRIRERNTSRLISPDRAVMLNNAISGLPADLQLDTTRLGIREVAESVCAYVVRRKTFYEMD